MNCDFKKGACVVKSKKLLSACLDLLFPPRCGVCGIYLNGKSRCICPTCRKNIVRVTEPLCAICGTEVHAADSGNHICGSCLKKCPPFTSARSLYHYSDGVRDLLSRLKYAGDESVIGALRELAGNVSLSYFNDCTFIAPVPLHKKRLRKRGFNQAVLFSNILFPDCSSLIKRDLLCRKVDTVPQVSLNGKSRRMNLKNVFAVNPSYDISGATVALVDDVYTTGTTVRECSRTLVENGAAGVHVVTFARVETPHRGRQSGGGKC